VVWLRVGKEEERRKKKVKGGKEEEEKNVFQVERRKLQG